MPRNLPDIQVMPWRELSWTPDPALQGWPEDVIEMPVRYYTNSSDPDTLIFNGLGGSPEDLAGTIGYLGKHGLTAAGIDLTYLKRVSLDLEHDNRQELTNHTLLRSGLAVMDDINSRSAYPRPRNLSGTSKGGAEALLLAGLIGRDPKLRPSLFKLVGSVAAVNTIGVANRGLGQGLEDIAQESRARRREFVKRMGENVTLHANIEPALDQIPMGDSVRVRETLMFEGAELVTKLVQNGVRVRMFSGSEDIVAPTYELVDELGEYASIVKSIPGHHASLSNDIGRGQLRSAVEWATTHEYNLNDFAPYLRRLKVVVATLSLPYLAGRLSGYGTKMAY